MNKRWRICGTGCCFIFALRLNRTRARRRLTPSIIRSPTSSGCASSRAYYDGAYTDAKLKFEAFQADKVAVNYLGELYAPLYELYAQQADGA